MKGISKKNIILLILVLILVVILGGTLAYFGWSSTSGGKDKEIDVTVSSVTGECSKLADNNKLLVPVSSKEKGRIITIKAKQNLAPDAVISWNLEVNKLKNDNDVTDGLKDESFRYELKNKTTGVSYGSGSFVEITDENNIIVFSSNQETLKYDKEYEFILYLWIDGVNFGNNPLNMNNQRYDFNIRCNITGVENEINPPKYLTTHVSNLYTPNDTGVNNNITYNLDTSDNLIEDVGGNIRYYGGDPDNYIYFNCDDYNNQNENTCELWRIVGVFGDKIKLVRDSKIGMFSWDFDYNDDQKSISYSNDWSKSSLNRLLNNEYLNNIERDIIYYNGNTTDTTVINFNTSNVGIKDSTRNLISNVAWNLGGISSNNLHYDEIYNQERSINVFIGNNTIWVGKVVFIYASDIAYGVDMKKCTNKTMIDFLDCKGDNWLLSDDSIWTMTSYSYDNKTVYGYSSTDVDGHTYNALGVRPTIYLNHNVVLDDGIGTKEEPYKLEVK